MRRAENTYDHIIIGAGAAGLHLTLGMLSEPSLNTKRVLVLDSSDKTQNDRTWCFWEKGKGAWDDFLTASWADGQFYGPRLNIPLTLNGYRYKMLRSIDFYTHALAKIREHDSFLFVQGKVSDVRKKEELFLVQTSDDSYYSESIFDSRIPREFEVKNDGHQRLLQHFKGKVIRTSETRFDPRSFTMMDFRASYGSSTSFCYVLPISETEALVEYTLFTEALLGQDQYEQLLDHEIKKQLKIQDYETIEEEFGVIPMTDFPFQNYSVPGHIKIGTAGGWVRPSSGYSFKNCERYATMIVQQLRERKEPNPYLFKKRHRFYDRILLNILLTENERGPELFEQMYARNPTDRILRFLDEKSSFYEELCFIWSLDKMPFLKALKRIYLG